MRWWSVTGGNSAYPGEYSDNADILYYSTHGYGDGAANTPYTNISYNNLANVERLWADITDTTSDRVINKGWKNKPIQTLSRWDNDLEWAIIAACNQIEYYGDNDGAHDYGKTLLGEPRRVHQVWGYHGLAPNNGPDSTVIKHFIKETNQVSSYAVATAWGRANTIPISNPNWSGVYHFANQGEATWSPESNPTGSKVTADTSNTSIPDINFKWKDGVRDVNF